MRLLCLTLLFFACFPLWLLVVFIWRPDKTAKERTHDEQQVVDASNHILAIICLLMIAGVIIAAVAA